MAQFSPPASETLDACIKKYQEERHRLDIFADGVRGYLAKHPDLISGSLPVVHSVRYRLKAEDHLREKIIRKKTQENRDINADNLLNEVTDLAGVRALHLHMEQFPHIHNAIMSQITSGHWALFEDPVAYTWDPELKQFFENLGLVTEFKDSHYTSVHYVVKPNETLQICCEIQVRTLFEEVWGEIDHVLNYPNPTSSIACREQLKVFAKIVGAGTRLGEAIFRSHRESLENSQANLLAEQ